MVREFKEKCETGELDRVSSIDDVPLSTHAFVDGPEQLDAEREHFEHV